MKTIADLILDDIPIQIEYQGVKLNVTSIIKMLVHYHYIDGVLDDRSETNTGLRFKFNYTVDNPYFEYDGNITAHISATYNNGIIAISVVHDHMDCAGCNGEGVVDGICDKCDRI